MPSSTTPSTSFESLAPRGRQVLAVIDALAWPGAWALAVLLAPVTMGVVGALVIAAAAMLAVRRVHRAWWHNERYRFTTAVWFPRVLWILAFGAVLVLASRALQG
jgi:hypothetical protein